MPSAVFLTAPGRAPKRTSRGGKPMLNRAQKGSGSQKTASDPGVGLNDGELVRHSNRWRDAYNPLRGLGISRVVQMIEAGERGDFAALQWLNRKVERRYPILRGLRTRWDAAIEEMDWGVKIFDKLPTGATKEMAEAQLKHLRSRYELVENLTETFGFLALADFRGFSILQKHRFYGGENDGAVRELHWLPQWNFVRDGMFGSFFYNKDFTFGATPELLGEKNRIGSDFLPREDFVVREVETPLYEVALPAFVNWAMGRKDWSAFVEIFGLAKGVVIMPPNIPPGKETEYRDAAEKTSEGNAGALPHGADMKFPTSSVRGDAPFKEYCEAQDADVVMAGTGGRLTMLTAEKGGLGDGPSSEQDDAFKGVGRAVARKINQTLQRDFDRCEINDAFPGQPVCVYFELAAVEEEDAKVIAETVVALDGVGLQSDAAEISTKTNLKLTRVEKPQPPNPVDPNNPPGNPPVPPIKNRGAQAVATELGVPVSWLQPVNELFVEIERRAKLPGFTRADAVSLLEKSIAKLPELFGDMNVTALAQLFESGMGAAAVEGLRAALAHKTNGTKL
jgi:phage gp29-like protein